MKTDTDNTPFCPCPSENLDNLRERTDRTHSLRVSVSGREKSRVLGSPRANNPVAEVDTDVGAPPCTGCYFERRCGRDLLACDAFADYVNTNRYRPGPRE